MERVKRNVAHEENKVISSSSGVLSCAVLEIYHLIALWPIHLFRVLGAHPCHDGSLVKS